jgi:pimeloyl-ACP methyl ester carboxylesterase
MSVLAIEYPGYGPAEGTPSEESVNDNLNTAFRFLKDLGYPDSNIILMGYSIGTGPVLQLAAHQCNAGTPPAAVITIAAFLSICDIIRDLKGTVILSLLAEAIANRWNSAEMVTQITCPLMLIHGMLDDVIPHTHSQQLYDRCVSSAKYLRLCANATHKQFEEPVDTVEPMATFLTETVRGIENVEIAQVPQFMFVCPHSVIETEKMTRSAKKGWCLLSVRYYT